MSSCFTWPCGSSVAVGPMASGWGILATGGGLGAFVSAMVASPSLSCASASRRFFFSAGFGDPPGRPGDRWCGLPLEEGVDGAGVSCALGFSEKKVLREGVFGVVLGPPVGALESSVWRGFFNMDVGSACPLALLLVLGVVEPLFLPLKPLVFFGGILKRSKGIPLEALSSAVALVGVDRVNRGWDESCGSPWGLAGAVSQSWELKLTVCIQGGA